jgi:SAM-dependent methyltransferase
MKPAARRLVISLAGFILIGCSARHEGGGGPVLSRDDSWSVGVGPTNVPETADMVGDGNASAVVFVEFVPTPQDVVERMLEAARVTKDDVVCDLGCGDGRIVITAARRYGCRAIGYDLDPLRVQEARKKATEHGVAHLVTIEQKDVLKVDLQDASVVTLYMGPELNVRLIPQLRRLGPGSRIVSHEFAIGDLTPDKVAEVTSRVDGRKHTIYLWTCPLPPVNQ